MQTIQISHPSIKIYLTAHPFSSGGGGVNAVSAIYEAGETLNAARAVVASGGKVYRFNPNDATHMRGIVGFTKTSAVAGAMVEVVFAGFFEDVGLSLSPDAPVFAGSNGVLSTTPPSSGIIACVGTSVSNKKFLISFKNLILT